MAQDLFNDIDTLRQSLGSADRHVQARIHERIKQAVKDLETPVVRSGTLNRKPAEDSFEDLFDNLPV